MMYNLKCNLKITNTHRIKQVANFIPRPCSPSWRRHFDALPHRVSQDYKKTYSKGITKELGVFQIKCIGTYAKYEEPSCRIFAWMPRFLISSVLIDGWQPMLLRRDNQLSLTWNICQLPWCKNLWHGRFQATNLIPLNLEVGRDGIHRFVWAEPTPAHHYFQQFQHALEISTGFTLKWGLWRGGKKPIGKFSTLCKCFEDFVEWWET